MDRIACLLALTAQEVGSTYHGDRRNREGVGRSLRNCRSARRNSAKRQETRRGCVCPARSPHGATLRYVWANELDEAQKLTFKHKKQNKIKIIRCLVCNVNLCNWCDHKFHGMKLALRDM